MPAGSQPAIGSLIRVTVKEHQPYGIVCDVDGSDDLVGLLTPPHRPPSPLKVGESCAAVVLDVFTLDGIVDLSAKPVRCPVSFFCRLSLNFYRRDPEIGSSLTARPGNKRYNELCYTGMRCITKTKSPVGTKSCKLYP